MRKRTIAGLGLRLAVAASALLMNADTPPPELAQAKSFIQQLSQNVRFIESAETQVNQQRFLEAIYWTVETFGVSDKPLPKILVIHVDKHMADFMGIEKYPAALHTLNERKIYEIWLVGKVTDPMMILSLSELFRREYQIPEDQSSQFAKKAYQHLQSTISVSEEKKP